MTQTNARNGLWLAVGIPVILAVGLLWMWSQDQAFKSQVVARLGTSTEAAVAAVDAARFDRLAARPEDAGTAEYAGLRDQLAKLTKVFSRDGLRGLYAMKVEGDEIRFFVDSAPVDDPWHSEPGVVYEEPPAAVAEVAGDGVTRFTGPYTDEYGRYYSTFAPVVDQAGRINAVMGADIEVAAYDRSLWEQRLPTLIATLLLVVVYFVVFLIITKRQQKLQLVRHYTRRLEILIDQMPVGVVIVEGHKGFPTMTNEAALSLLGREIDPSKDAESFVETYGIMREDGSSYPESGLPLAVTLATGRQASKSGMFVKQKDGSKIAIRMASVPIRDEKEQVAAVVVVLEDMTKEYEIDRQKSEFISIASHELRAPLTAIKWNTDLLLDEREGALNAEQKAYATHINEINDRLVSLVSELLDVSRLETGTVGVSPAKTDMAALIESVLADLAGLYRKKRQEMIHRKTALPEISVDARLVRQALTNLISNAVKYTPVGGAITVTAETRGNDLRITVADTGIGIPKAQQSQVFKKFFRADNANANNIEGTGLGLFICKQAVELSGGTIGFESEENRGATFWFTLPLSGSVRKEGAKHRAA